MRRAAAVFVAAAVVVWTAGVMAQAKPNFAGKWTCTDCPAPGGGGGGGGRGGGGFGGGGLGPEFTATQDAAALTITRTVGENTMTVKYMLDGSESKNSVMAGRGGAQEQISKATWDGAKLVVVTTLANGERRQVFSLEGGNLVVETTAPGRGGGDPTTTKQTYKKS